MTKTQYDPVAIALHWLIAVLIILMIPLGFFMGDLPVAVKFDGYILHKSLGIIVLTLSIFRLIWRLLNPPPALPAAMPRVQRLVSACVHWALYGLMVGMPLTGWLMVSASQKYPTVFLWMGEVPFLPMPPAWMGKEPAHDFKELHELFAFGAIALIALHVGAALKHHFIERDAVMVRMLPKLKQRHAK